MPMTALDIYKVLPKTNCGDCGVPTCLAFAMQLATKKAGIDDCPHATDEAKSALAGAEAPPIRLVSVGPEAQCIVMGKETVFFRHEETFYHPTALAVRVRSDKPEDELRTALERVKALVFDRVGQYVRVELVAIEDADGDADRFAAAAAMAAEMELSLVLISSSPAVIEAALPGLAGQRPLLDAATSRVLGGHDGAGQDPRLSPGGPGTGHGRAGRAGHEGGRPGRDRPGHRQRCPWPGADPA